MKTHSMASFIVVLAPLIAALPARLAAQQPAGPGTAATATQSPDHTSAPAVIPASRPALSDFAWLVGTWQGSWGPRIARQVWIAPKAGVIVGTFQLVEGDKTLVLELFTLVQEPDGIKLRLRHFTPALVAWEKSGPTVLSLSSIDSKKAIFENQVDGEPKREVFTQVDPDSFVSRSEIVPEQGDTQVTEVIYHRQLEAPAKRGKNKPRQ